MKLQPNFSWQKYEGRPEDYKEQFQYQLQQQHIQVSNTTNATIDDASYWTRERQASFTWVDGKAIWTKTLPTSAWTAVGTINTIPMGIAGAANSFRIIDIQCCLSNGTSYTVSNTVLLPHIDVAVPANEISIVRNTTNIILTSGGTDYSAWSGYVTIHYTKS